MVRENGEIIDTKQGYIGKGISNYQAEYQALLKALEYVSNQLDTKDRRVRIFLDCGKVYKQCPDNNKNINNKLSKNIDQGSKLVHKFLNKIDGEVEFNKTNSDGVREAHLLCSSQYTLLHPFPGYIRDLEPEGLIK